MHQELFTIAQQHKLIVTAAGRRFSRVIVLIFFGTVLCRPTPNWEPAMTWP